MTLVLDQALVLQAGQRSAHRRAPHPQLAGDVHLDQAFAGLEAAGDDGVAQPVLDSGLVAAVHGSDCLIAAAGCFLPAAIGTRLFARAAGGDRLFLPAAGGDCLFLPPAGGSRLFVPGRAATSVSSPRRAATACSSPRRAATTFPPHGASRGSSSGGRAQDG